MISSLPDKNRNVIPRWRAFKVAAALDELRSSLTRQRSTGWLMPSHAFERNLRAWRNSKSLSNAAELVLSSVVSGRGDEVADAAAYLLNEKISAVPALKTLARRIQSNSTNDSETPEIPNVRAQREFTKFEPRNAIGWTDLALAHFSIGNERKAQRELEVALRLAPENRHVLRAAACFFANTGHPDEANYLLNRSSRTYHDPWLSAAEIATATLAGRRSKLARKARESVLRSDFGARDSAELASAIATLELENGNTKQSRKLFKVSLEDPTENAIAQAQWATEHRHLSLPVNPAHFKEPLAFESIARNAYALDDWSGCVDALENWSKDQPFLAQPYIVGSFVASEFMDKPARSLNFTRSGIKIHPNDVTLHNNAAVSYARLKMFGEASDSLARAYALSDKANVAEQALLKATAGLLSFRKGNAEAGRKAYWDAIIKAVDAKNRRLARRAYLHLMHEEVLYNPLVADVARNALEPLQKLAKGTTFEKEFRAVTHRIDFLAETIMADRRSQPTELLSSERNLELVLNELTSPENS